MKFTVPNEKILVKLNREDEVNLHATLALLRGLYDEMEKNYFSTINCDYNNEFEIDDLEECIVLLESLICIESIS